MNFELIKSLQKLASTKAGESCLSASERISLGSKLKESKMSATSFGTIAGFDNSHGSTNKKHTLNKIKSEAQFKDLHGRDAMRL